MGRRRTGRELALKVLFQVDLTDAAVEEALEAASKAKRPDSQAREFARSLIEQVVEHKDEIDELLGRYTKQWPLERMANVDRALLRMATGEILYFPDIPSSVSVDEAVELAKKYSTGESGRFINGVLGSLLRDMSGQAGNGPTDKEPVCPK